MVHAAARRPGLPACLEAEPDVAPGPRVAARALALSGLEGELQHAGFGRTRPDLRATPGGGTPVTALPSDLV